MYLSNFQKQEINENPKYWEVCYYWTESDFMEHKIKYTPITKRQFNRICSLKGVTADYNDYKQGIILEGQKIINKVKQDVKNIAIREEQDNLKN